MTNVKYLESTFKMWELVLMATSPTFIKSISINLKYDDVAKYDTYTILMGTINFIITLEDRQFSIEWIGATECYNEQEPKEKAEKIIAGMLKSVLVDEFKNKKYESLWDKIDFDNETWKREEC